MPDRCAEILYRARRLVSRMSENLWQDELLINHFAATFSTLKLMEIARIFKQTSPTVSSPSATFPLTRATAAVL